MHGDPAMQIYTASITPAGLRTRRRGRGRHVADLHVAGADGTRDRARARGLRESRQAASLAGFDIAPYVRISMGDDLAACRDALRPELALYIGGMGARGKNFYNDVARRLGYEAEAAKIQDLFLAGHKDEATAAVPDKLIDEISLVGPADADQGSVAGVETGRAGSQHRHAGARRGGCERAPHGRGGGAVAMEAARLAVDIGGTFTDLALETCRAARDREGADDAGGAGAGRDDGRADDSALRRACGRRYRHHDPRHHARHQRARSSAKGAKTALLTTQGFRDVLAMGNESRYDQYDLNIVLPEPLVPRYLRLPVPERLDNEGKVLLPLDESAVRALVPLLRREGVESIAVGFLHAFVNPAHERRVRDILAQRTARHAGFAVVAKSRRRCANGSASPPPSPTPMCSR